MPEGFLFDVGYFDEMVFDQQPDYQILPVKADFEIAFPSWLVTPDNWTGRVFIA